MTEHTPTPWKLCGADGKHFCGHIWSADGNSHIVTAISGEWGDHYPSLRFVEGTGGAGSINPKIEAYNEIIAYGEIPEDVAKANARFIVTACNCHDDLLETLKNIMNGPMLTWKGPLIDKAKEEIRKAEETP